MMPLTAPAGPTSRRPARHHRGAALPIALILSVVLALSAVSFIKMVGTSTSLARNASFQRDALNRNEVAMNTAIREFENTPGAHFAELANTDTTVQGQGGGLAYSATALPTDDQGIPLVLKDDAAFGAQFGGVLAGSEIALGEGMTTRVVIDRLCTLEAPVAAEHCSVGTLRAQDHCSRCSRVSTPLVPVFRVSARTQGPRRTESYSQGLFAIAIE